MPKYPECLQSERKKGQGGTLKHYDAAKPKNYLLQIQKIKYLFSHDIAKKDEGETRK